MPKFAIVIKDPALAHAKEIERNVEANLRVRPDLTRSMVEGAVRRFIGGERKAGDVHTEMDSECPAGLPNCRNCGDPAFRDQCAREGHCPHCGTRHGIAPDSVIAANGYELVQRINAVVSSRLYVLDID